MLFIRFLFHRSEALTLVLRFLTCWMRRLNWVRVYSVLFLRDQTFPDYILSEILMCKLGKRWIQATSGPRGTLWATPNVCRNRLGNHYSVTSSALICPGAFRTCGADEHNLDPKWDFDCGESFYKRSYKLSRRVGTYLLCAIFLNKGSYAILCEDLLITEKSNKFFGKCLVSSTLTWSHIYLLWLSLWKWN